MAFQIKDEVGLVEIVTASTALAVTFSAVYNFGYFSKFESSFISTLTFQDFVVGAAIAFVPTALAVQAILWLVSSAEDADPKQFLIAIGMLGVWYGGIAIYYVINREISLVTQTIISSAFIGGYLLLARKWPYFVKSPGGLLSLATGIYFGVSGLGSAAYLYDTSKYERPDTIVELQENKVEGRLIRMTSTYLLLFNGTTTTALPLRDVKSIRTTHWGEQPWVR